MVNFQHINSEFHSGFCCQADLVTLPRAKKTDFKDSLILGEHGLVLPDNVSGQPFMWQVWPPGLLFSVRVCVGWLRGMTCVILCS